MEQWRRKAPCWIVVFPACFIHKHELNRPQYAAIWFRHMFLSQTVNLYKGNTQAVYEKILQRPIVSRPCYPNIALNYLFSPIRFLQWFHGFINKTCEGDAIQRYTVLMENKL